MPRAMIVAILAAVFGLPLAADAAPDDLAALRRDVAALRKQQNEIARQLTEIRALLDKQPPSAQKVAGEKPAADAPTEVSIETAGSPSEGNPAAPLVIVEFLDYQCPFCARHHRDTVPALTKQYIAAGKLRYVVRHFPLEAIHAEAFKAHEAARCADEQGKFWPMHARLLENQQSLDRKGLEAHADAVGLKLGSFRDCLDSGRQAAAIRKDLADGAAAGVSGTPSFFLGRLTPGQSQLRAVKTIGGAQPLAAFQREIDQLLAEPPAAKP